MGGGGFGGKFMGGGGGQIPSYPHRGSGLSLWKKGF